MIEFHVLTPRGAELIMQVVDGSPVLPSDRQRLGRRPETDAAMPRMDGEPMECAPARPGEVTRHE